MEFLLGRRFKLGNKIGVGGFGEVFEATDTKTNQRVALKLENRAGGTPVLGYEFKMLQGLKGLPCIPKVIKFGLEGDYNYMAMDYIGFSLEHFHSYCQRQFSPTVRYSSNIRQSASSPLKASKLSGISTTEASSTGT